MAQGTLYHKVFDEHVVRKLPTGQYQLFIGLHLIHEVTSPQAFDMLEKEIKRPVKYPDLCLATIDHIVPTLSTSRPFQDPLAETMMSVWESNVKKHNIPYLDFASGRQGIVHVIAPELGLTQPGVTIACGDSHTSTHGAFGTLAFGVGTTPIRDLLASQTLPVDRLQVRKIDVTGELQDGVYSKDVILTILRQLGTSGGKGYAYEYAGDIVSHMSMEERLTMCNMTIEGGSLCGYVNPDETTFAYIKGRPYAPSTEFWDEAVAYWQSIVSDPDAQYDDLVTINGSELEPVVTWGTNPGQSVSIHEPMPKPETLAEPDDARDAYDHMGFKPGRPLYGQSIDVAFIGSCTNGRISDLREAAKVVQGRKKARNVRALVVPGSQQVKEQAEKEGLHEIFQEADFEWRGAGCSMCLAMNPDKLQGREICASSSNRNFKGRQGSDVGRTLLMSPAMVAAAGIEGAVTDVREILRGNYESK